MKGVDFTHSRNGGIFLGTLNLPSGRAASVAAANGYGLANYIFYSIPVALPNKILNRRWSANFVEYF